MKLDYPRRLTRILFCALAHLILVACISSSTPEEAILPIPSPTPTQIHTPTATTPKPTPDKNLRPSTIAGTWYPADPDELEGITSSLLERIKPVDGKPIALVVPHAGYVYSGPVAAYGFKQIQAYDYEIAIIIAADHQPPLSEPISIWTEGGFETPLGVVPVDTELARNIVDSHPLITDDTAPHAGEHPIEIQLPFLQSVCPQCSIVPILMGDDQEESIGALSGALLENLKGKNAVVIASSDLSHYPQYDHAISVDSATISAIETNDPDLLRETNRESMGAGIPNLVTCACGQAPILVAMQVAKGLGANTTTLLSYANSGDSPYGDRDQVVGYAAIMFWRHEPLSLTAEQEDQLLSLARRTIQAYLADQELPPFESQDQEFYRLVNVFVTLKKGGELRGCIGQLKAFLPLYQAIQQAAISAATEDARFPPVESDELPEVTIEISILSPFKRVIDIETIEVGTHGLLIYRAGHSGLLLPRWLWRVVGIANSSLRIYASRLVFPRIAGEKMLPCTPSKPSILGSSENHYPAVIPVI